jgi:hypothetical protein
MNIKKVNVRTIISSRLVNIGINNLL